MLVSLDRFSGRRESTLAYSATKSLKKSREVQNGKAIKLHENGKGKRPHQATHALADKEVELLWQRVFGTNSAESLNCTV